MMPFYSQMAKADFEGAGRSMDEAIRLWPSNARYHSWLGYVISQNLPSQCSGIGPEDARTGRTSRGGLPARASAQWPGRRGAPQSRMARSSAGHDREARQEWGQAVALDPDTAIYHLSLGMFLEEAGDADAANRQYIAALDLSPSILDSPFFTRYRARSPERAEAVVREAMSQTETRLGNSNDPILKARLGKFYLYRGDLQRAGGDAGELRARPAQPADGVVQPGRSPRVSRGIARKPGPAIRRPGFSMEAWPGRRCAWARCTTKPGSGRRRSAELRSGRAEVGAHQPGDGGAQ